ncbi:MAG: acyltransferase [Clostridia bacterium]|nr:acyltransferase [Clostridia bacterium]
MENRLRNTSFDLFKGISCIAVVLIHYSFTQSLETLGHAITALCKFAVPVFFAISGYYLSSDQHIPDERVLRKIRHILKLILASACFYAVFCLIWNSFYIKDFTVAAYQTNKLHAGRIVKLFLTNDPIVYPHLWFLLALLYCYTTVLFLFKQGKRSMLYCSLTPFLMFGMILLQEFSHIVPIKNSVRIPESDQMLWFYNLFIFRALPFFMFGMLCRIKQESIRTLPGSLWSWLLVAALGCCCAVAERFTLGKSCQFFIGSYITFFAIMIISIKYPTLNQPVLTFIGRELSLYIYILHIAIGKTYDLVASHYNLWKKPLYFFTRPLVVVVGSLLVALLLRSIMQITKKLSTRIRIAH